MALTVISGPQLKALRLRAGLSTERVALAIGRSAYSIQEYERGRVHPPVHVLLSLAEVFGCSLNDLVTDAELAGVA